jgi:hypothetical protein
MAPTARALLVPLLLVLALAVASSAGQLVGWELGAVVGALEDDEWGLDAGGYTVMRRVLQRGDRYVSYSMLRRGYVPCSFHGAPYYNCRPGAQVNPYTRGCSAITRCRS